MRRLIGCIVFLLLAGALLAGCATPTPDGEPFTSPLSGGEALTSPLPPADQTVARSVLPTPEPRPTSVPPTSQPTAVPTAAPTAMPTTQPAAGPRLVLLHTNDNWGETEPCG